MLQTSNYRISLKKNISLKTIDGFNSAKRVSDPFQPINGRIKKQKQKASSNTLSSTQNSVFLSRQVENKTFSFDSSDQYIKKILIANQWHLLPNDFPQVKLKWLVVPKTFHFQSLEKNQMINHFKDSYKLTTKLGLYNLLSNPHQQNLTDGDGQNYLKYLPRSYDLGSEFDAFCSDFNHTAVLNLMKKLMIHVEIMHEKTLYLKYKRLCQAKNFKNSQEKFLEEIDKTLQTKGEIFERQPFDQRILVNRTLFINLLKYWKHHFNGNELQQISCSSIVQCLKSFSKLNPPFNNPDFHFKNQTEIAFLNHSSAILFFKLYFYCLQAYPNFLNDGLSNIWIIKSNESSRGRNIFLIDEIEQTLPYRNGGNKLIQKYIENIWILNQNQISQSIQKTKIKKIVNKKFDIRFWVLVKSFAPLDAYIFNEGYLRLSSQIYKFSTHQSLQKNLKKHLTNFSVNFLPDLKNRNPKNTKDESEQDFSYLLFSEFLNLCEEQGKQNSKETIEESVLFQKIFKKIQYILMTASINWRPSETDKNSFQLFGFDIILDSELEPYVLECNMSPACHERGKLKNLVEQMGEGLLQLIGLIRFQTQSVLKTDLQIERIKRKRRKWIKFNIDQQNLGNFNNESSLRGNYQELYILGQSKESKFIIEQEMRINFIEKIQLLQRFFKTRYLKSINQLTICRNFSLSCSMIEALTKILKKRQRVWAKKFIKYIRKLTKKRQKQLRIEAKK